MKNVDGIFSFALRFHPDTAELSAHDFRRSCYVNLLHREPEPGLKKISTIDMLDRAQMWKDFVNSEEFGRHSLPLDHKILSKICRSLGWNENNSACYYACRYVSATSVSYDDFVNRLHTAISKNSVARSNIIYTIENHSDSALIHSLLDGLVDISSEFSMAIADMDAIKIRLSAIEASMIEKN
jgi:hypothetical protein